MLASMECVDFVVPFSEDTPVSLIKLLSPTMIVKGHDSQGKCIPGTEFAPVKFAPSGGFSGHSSEISHLIETASSGYNQ